MYYVVPSADVAEMIVCDMNRYLNRKPGRKRSGRCARGATRGYHQRSARNIGTRGAYWVQIIQPAKVTAPDRRCYAELPLCY